MRTYSELIQLPTFEERLLYLKLDSKVGFTTFGGNRYMNQQFYNSKEWKDICSFVITRDNGCDLGVKGYELFDDILVHHMNPINVDDIRFSTPFLLDPEYLISTSRRTHNDIHYGNDTIISREPIIRKPNDTIPWKQ